MPWIRRTGSSRPVLTFEESTRDLNAKKIQSAITAEADIQLDQMIDILRAKLVKRSIDPKVMDIGDQEHVGKLLHKNIKIQEGIESLLAKKSRQNDQR